MWGFLQQVLETGGLVAVSFAALGVGSFFALKLLWNTNQSLQAKLDALQEKRVEESKAVVEQVVTHASNVDRTVEKLDGVFDRMLAALRKE